MTETKQATTASEAAGPSPSHHTSAPPHHTGPGVRRTGWYQPLVVVLIAAGVATWLRYAATVSGPALIPYQIYESVTRGVPIRVTALDVVLAVAFVTLLIPHVHRPIARWLDRLRTPSPRAVAITAVTIGVLVAGRYYAGAIYQDRSFHYRYHDEAAYLIQAQMLARGHLWMPRHPVAESFEAFHIFIEPVYASSYFPGTALLYVPHVWLGVPPWVISLLASGLIAGLLYVVVTRAIDGLAGLLSVVMLLGMVQFGELTIMTMSHLVVTLLGLLVTYTWMRWRDATSAGGGQQWHWALLVGAFAGWAAVTRPVDAIAYAAPVGAAMLVTLARMPHRVAWRSPALVVLGALPFLALQLALNHGITGTVTKTPLEMYFERYHPGSEYGPDGGLVDRAPQTQLPQKIDYYEQFIRPQVQDYASGVGWPAMMDERLGSIWAVALPGGALLVLWPASLAGLVTLRRAVLWSVLPLYLLLYALYPLFLMHYPVVVMPATIFGVLLGKHVIETTWRRPHALLTTALTGLVVAATIVLLPEVNPLSRDERLPSAEMARDARLAEELRTPALVFYRYTDAASFHEEPAYNVDVAWADDAAIVRAQDRGPAQNDRLIRHYAQLGQDRHVYFIERPRGEPRYAGTVTGVADGPTTRGDLVN